MTRTHQKILNYEEAFFKLREQGGMTREALAEASGVSPSYLSEVERGLKRPSTDVLAKIAEAFGMLPSQLLEYVETRSGRPAPEVLASIAAPQSRRKWAAGVMSAKLFEPSEPQMESDALAELVALAGKLDDEDLKVLLALARRLQNRSR